MKFIFQSASFRSMVVLLLAIPVLMGCFLTAGATGLPKEEDIVAPDYVRSVPDMVPSDRSTVIEDVRAVVLPGCVREGYLFLGWNTSASMDGIHYNVGDTYIVDGMQTLYGEWRKLDSGNGVTSTNVIVPTGPSGTLVPGFTVTSSGMPNMAVLNQQAEDATPAGQRFDCWRITTATVDEYIAPDRAERRLRQILETEVDITLCAYYVWQ